MTGRVGRWRSLLPGHGAGWLALVAVAGCSMDRTSLGGARLAASWVNETKEKTTVSLPAEAIWCARLHLLQVTAVSGDTGIGLAFHPGDSALSGAYQVHEGEKLPTSGRTVSAAGRWFTETLIRGYQADSGGAVLREEKPGVSLQFTFRMRSAIGTGPIEVIGRTSVPVDSSGTSCPIDSLGSVPPAGPR